VLLRRTGGELILVIEQGNLCDVTDLDRPQASVIALDGILGERRRLELICEIESVRAFEPEHAKASPPITLLTEDMDRLFPARAE
jgi:hypothetical protein